MLRSLYSGVSGMKNFQTKLDTIGNNIANVNTYGFKKSRVTFKDTISQTLAGATAGSNPGMGGTNAKQIGLGSTTGSIDIIDTQGSPESTGRMLDLEINGDGYFALQGKDTQTTYYTRAGNFYLDDDGYIVNSDGYKLLNSDGETMNINSSEVTGFSIASDGTINLTDAEGANPENPGRVGVVTFPNPAGLTKAGGNLYLDSVSSGAPNNNNRIPGTGSNGSIESGFLEMSNVDLSEELTNMIVAERGFQANTRIITTSDEILQELVNLKR
ncbi:flagellar basal body rod protein FlgG [Heyndrickxia acidiproducens]|uniref:flagellar basal body rod protein FlgG n=1 Tax=Heyndrickxia acidiproducens TaxID=1121084 RepID=UPI00036F3A61|nr:flagellar basal body rod protein FlgG [Heyndrickxia acidiproducens]